MKKKIFLFILVFVALFSITGCGEKKGAGSENVNNAFFIKEGSNYALFNDSGKKLTDFEFTSAGSFVNGAALVKKDDAIGVINTSGKMVIPFGKYKYVYQESGLYKVTDENSNTYLINSKGNTVADLKDKTLNTYISSKNFVIIFDKTKNEYSFMDVNGKVIFTFAKGSSSDKPTTSSESNYITVFNGNKNYVVDYENGKKLLEFDADTAYCVNGSSKDGKIIVLNSCVGTFQKQDVVTYKFIKDGKLQDLGNKCSRVAYLYDSLICYENSNPHILDSNYNVGFDITLVSFIDANHYVKEKDGSFNGVDFYENGNVIKNVECRTVYEKGYNNEGLYILNTYYSKPCGTTSGTYEYYNAKGENAFGKSFKSAQKFDSNSLARVSEDRTNYYLIDKTGKKVTEDYNTINAYSDNYIVIKNKLYGVLDGTGKQVVEPIYSKVDITKQNGVAYAKLTTSDSKYIIFNINTKKEVATFDSAPSLLTNYITVTVDGKKQYYTYTGKLFYTEP